MRYSFEQLKEILRQAGWPEGLQDLFAAIGLGESGGKLGAINPGYGAGGRRTNEYSIGLWQINTLAHPQYDRYRLATDPVYNAKAALEIFRSEGVRAWGSYTDGRYRSYLPNGSAPADATSILGLPAGTALDLASSLRSYLSRPIQAAEDRFRPYLGQPGVSAQMRFQIAAMIAIVVIAFAWREL